MHARARYFDGRTAASKTGALEFDNPVLRFVSDGDNVTVSPATARLVTPVGAGRWVLELADGGRIEWEDDTLGRRLAIDYGSGGWVRRIEGRWRWALLALAVTMAGTWAMLTYGVPVAARHIALSIPPEVDRQISAQSIEFLDRLMFEPTGLPESKQTEIRAQFDAIVASDPRFAEYRLGFRRSDSVGANAFAVPGGLVIVTDEMVEIADNDAEIVSVLAHEVGHLAQRHSLRILLQNSTSAVIIAGLTGDLSNVTALSATVPTVLMHAKYSRDFEREADRFAFVYLERHGMDPRALSRLLERIEAADSDRGQPASTWLSSHPQSTERVPERSR